MTSTTATTAPVFTMRELERQLGIAAEQVELMAYLTAQECDDDTVTDAARRAAEYQVAHLELMLESHPAAVGYVGSVLATAYDRGEANVRGVKLADVLHDLGVIAAAKSGRI